VITVKIKWAKRKIDMGTIQNIAKGVIKKIRKTFTNRYEKLGYDWMQVRFIKNLPEQKLHTVPFLHKKISFVSRDEFLHTAEEIFVNEIYKQQLPKNALIIDCGANIGLSVLYLKLQTPSARIIAFEPDENNFNLLKSNVSHFGFTGIELRKEAVWIEDTTLQFESQGSLMGHISENASGSSSAQVKATRLKNFLNEPVHFLKIDIEGAEYKVVKDIAGSLNNVQSFFLEYHGTFQQNDELNEIFHILRNAGFEYYIKHAIDKHPTPFERKQSPDYDVQLNIFAFRK
jgi:FkbM family methyltransferase